jgi:hypothetical protein
MTPFILPHTHSFFLALRRAPAARRLPPRARPNGGSDAPILYAPHDDRPLIFEHVSKNGFNKKRSLPGERILELLARLPTIDPDAGTLARWHQRPGAITFEVSGRVVGRDTATAARDAPFS